MTSTEPITPKELLELASLDAMGLLDDFEATVYTRAFHEAPATVQDEVVRLQAQVAGDLSLLPGDEPDPKLRERVLKAVAAAIERNDDALAPLASIGRRRRGIRDAERRFLSGSPAMYWRAASFMLAASALAMAYFLAIGYQSSIELWRAARWDDATKLEVILGRTAKQFLLDDSIKKQLTAVVDDQPYAGSLYINDTTGQVLVLVDNLPKTGDRAYILQVVTVDGTTQLQRFASLGGFGGTVVENVSASLIANAFKWQIATLDGEILLTSA